MPRKELADPMKLKVVFEPDEGGWHVYVPSLPGCRTWGRSLSEARKNIREAISLQEEQFEDADVVARDAVFVEDIRLSSQERALLKRAESAKLRAQAYTAKAKAASSTAAQRLTMKLSLRDVGELTGMSQEGVRKLLNAAKSKGAKTVPVDRRRAR